MIAHEAVGVHLPTGFLTGLSQGFEEVLPVHIVQVNVFPAVPAAHDVVNGSGVLDSRRSVLKTPGFGPVAQLSTDFVGFHESPEQATQQSNRNRGHFNGEPHRASLAIARHVNREKSMQKLLLWFDGFERVKPAKTFQTFSCSCLLRLIEWN